MTILQEKLAQAVKLLLEAKQIAEANGQAYRSAHPENLALARNFECIAEDLTTNHSLSIEKIARMAGFPVETITNQDELKTEIHLGYDILRSLAMLEGGGN